MINVKSLMKGICLTTALGLSAMTQAADWAPKGTLKLQIGFAAGGSTDTIGRVVAKVMKEQTGWNVIAENKAGAGGVAMLTGIAKMPAKGQVIGLGVNIPVLLQLTLKGDKLPFNLNSFDYLGTAANAQLALIARQDAPFNNLEEMVEYARANGGMSVATNAKPQNILMNFVNKQAGVEFRYVSTKGESEVQKLMLGGQVMAGFSAGTHVKYIESGDFKMIAAATAKRHNYAPEAKTFQESGYDAYIDPWWFFATTAGTPDNAKRALSEAIANAMDSEEVKTVIQNAISVPADNVGAQATGAIMVNGLDTVKGLLGKK